MTEKKGEEKLREEGSNVFIFILRNFNFNETTKSSIRY